MQHLNGHAGKRPRGATGTRSALSQARGGLPPRAGRGGSGSYSPPEMPAEGVSHHQHRTDTGSMVIWHACHPCRCVAHAAHPSLVYAAVQNVEVRSSLC